MTLEDILKRLQNLEDIEEIKQLQIHYVNCLTFVDWDEIANCFAEDGEIDIQWPGVPVAKGRPDIELFFKKVISPGHFGKEGNFVVHPIVSVDGDKAKGSWLLYQMFAHPSTGQSLFWVQGTYDCEYIREKGKWKISHLKFKGRLLPANFPAGPTGDDIRGFEQMRPHST